MLRGTNKRVLSGVMCGRQRRGGVIIMVGVMSLQSLTYVITIVSHHHAPCRVIAIA